MIELPAPSEDVKHGLFPFGVKYTLPGYDIGHALIDNAVLFKKVGRTASRVWGIMMGLRDQTGETHPTRAGLARMLGLTESAVAGGLRKLRKLGMVVPTGKKWVRPAEPRGKNEPEWPLILAYTWFVRGRPIGKNLTHTFLPTAVVWEINALKSHGGRRAGAGRPKAASDVAPASTLVLNSSVPAYREHKSSSFPSLREGKKSDTQARARGASAALGLGFSGSQPMRELKADMAEGALLGTGLRLGGEASASHGLFPWLVQQKIIPPFPSADIVAIVRRPPPPLLMSHGQQEPNDFRDKRWAETLAAAYRGAAEHVFGEKSWVLAKGDVTKSKHFGHLKASAKLLYEYQISPVEFAVWRLQHAKEDGARKPRGLKWVFGPVKQPQIRGWFRREASAGGSTAVTRPHQELIRRYARMKLRILQLGSRFTPDRAKMVAGRAFPDKLYSRLVESAQRESAESQRLIDLMITRGEYIW